MPTAIADDYKKLLSKTLPKVIETETEAEYESVVGTLSELMGKGSQRTSGEARLMRLLQLLVGDYDRRHAMPSSKMLPHEALNYLLETSGRTPIDLIGIFSQRSHVNEALNGRRKISADQARDLGALFRVNPGLFI